MPTYEYECVKKGHRFEVLQKLKDKPLTKCQVCGAKARKLISATSFQLKGGGWYKDGYGSTGAGKSKAKETTAPSKKPEKSEAPSKTKKAD